MASVTKKIVKITLVVIGLPVIIPALILVSIFLLIFAVSNWLSTDDTFKESIEAVL